MEWSKYNVIFKYGQRWLLYNSVSNIFAEMDQELYDVIMQIKMSPDTFVFTEEYKELQNQLCNNFILVNSDKEIFHSIKFNVHKNRFQTEHLCLTVLPTLDCNFRCPYCFEKEHECAYMTKEVMDAIVEYVKGFPALKTLGIAWMGGEPLLAMDVIEYITGEIRKLGIDIHASVVTNGYLLNEDTFFRLVSSGVNSIQVTIDGLKEKHDKRRILKNKEATFDTIINNIKLIVEKKQNINLSIRVNIDRKNQDEFKELKKYLVNQLNNNIWIYPGFIEEAPYGCAKNSCALNRDEKVYFYLDKMPKEKQSSFFYPSPVGGECLTARNINSFVIGPSGELYKCWECIGKKEMVVGNIANMEITNPALNLLFLTGSDFLEDNKCKKCKVLPICYGGCPIRRIDKDYYGKNTDFCSIFKGNISKFLTLHYKIKAQ